MRTFILGISVLYIVTSGDQFRIGIGNCYETLRIMESRHCPYLALPNMVSELMVDSISFSWLYCGSAMSEPIGRSSSQRKELEPIQFHKPSFWPSARTNQVTLSSSKSLSRSLCLADRNPLRWSGRAQCPCGFIPHKYNLLVFVFW